MVPLHLPALQVIENQIMAGLEAFPELKRMIAEFFFEWHFDAPEMRASFGTGLASNSADCAHGMRQLRDAGLRIHFWP